MQDIDHFAMAAMQALICAHHINAKELQAESEKELSRVYAVADASYAIAEIMMITRTGRHDAEQEATIQDFYQQNRS